VKKILVTGAVGFIGRAVCKNLVSKNKIIAFDQTVVQNSHPNYFPVKGNITDDLQIKQLCDDYQFDFIIHCAGIAHQKAWTIGPEIYQKVNSRAVKMLAQAASNANSEVHFIFLSSISVYGEENDYKIIDEDTPCKPTSDYAVSKLSAENYLKDLFKRDEIKKVDLLRLSPVYDLKNTINIDKRIFAPKKIAYIKAGNGRQKMTTLARGNLIDFIEFRLNANCSKDKINSMFFNIFNISDRFPYTFKQIIRIFNQSKYQPNRIIIKLPLFFIKVFILVSSFIMPKRKVWLYAAYKKISSDLVFENEKMLHEGFDPAHNLSTVFLDQNEK